LKPISISGQDEFWTDISGYEGLYQVSSLGMLRNHPKRKRLHHGGTYFTKQHILNPSIRGGYKIIVLTKNKVRRTHSVNRLVATEFVANPYNKPDVNHDNGIRTDDRACNLSWCTKSENAIHAYSILKRKPSRKPGMPSKISVVQKTKRGKFINSYPSMSSAERNTGISRHHIGKCIKKKRKLAGGFVWK
jgi:hypothetical protein